MDKGQHIRLLITDNSEKNVVALATDLTFHLSAATEDSTTKDSSDTNGEWNEYDVTNRSGDIQFSALAGVGTDPYSPATTEPAAPEVIGGLSFADWINQLEAGDGKQHQQPLDRQDHLLGTGQNLESDRTGLCFGS